MIPMNPTDLKEKYRVYISTLVQQILAFEYCLFNGSRGQESTSSPRLIISLARMTRFTQLWFTLAISAFCYAAALPTRPSGDCVAPSSLTPQTNIFPSQFQISGTQSPISQAQVSYLTARILHSIKLLLTMDRVIAGYYCGKLCSYVQ
jgi:hypothetical protein